MRKQLLHVLIISFVFISMPVIHSAEEEKDRLLVVPLKPQKGIDQEEANILTDLLSVEIHRSGKFKILNRDDMKAILDEKEFEQHDKGLVQSTRHRRPLELVYYEACLLKEDSLRREKYLKTHYGKMFLKKSLKSYFMG